VRGALSDSGLQHANMEKVRRIQHVLTEAVVGLCAIIFIGNTATSRVFGASSLFSEMEGKPRSVWSLKAAAKQCASSIDSERAIMMEESSAKEAERNALVNIIGKSESQRACSLTRGNLFKNHCLHKRRQRMDWPQLTKLK